MSADLQEVRELETRMMNAWPALETHIVGKWIVRTANGYSRRANSASALVEGARLDDEERARIEELFDGAKLTPVVRITPLADPDVDRDLARLGWHEGVPSLVMVAALDESLAGEAGTELESRASDGWIAANARSYGGMKSNAAHLAAIVSRIKQPAVFATLTDNGAPAAWGIGVTERGFVALEDLVVRPELRGKGFGRRLTKALMAEGQRAGARHAFLQVSEDNAIARRLYESLGFVTAYRYAHRMR